MVSFALFDTFKDLSLLVVSLGEVLEAVRLVERLQLSCGFIGAEFDAVVSFP